VKLATRISLFFLVALAVVLIGFSGAIFLMAKSHLYSQFEARSADALATLNAAIESDSTGLEWEVSERNVNLGLMNSAPIVWAVFDEHGARVDGSLDGAELFNAASKSTKVGDEPGTDIVWNGDIWRVLRHEVQSTLSHDPAAGSSAGSEQNGKRYSALTLAVGSSITPLTSQLRTLGFTLIGLMSLIWVAAALLGSRVCQKALRPLTQMTDTISTISLADPDSRLLPTATVDELEDLSLAFNALLDRLNASFEQQRRFAADASHQLRTPLTALQGQVEVALRRERSADEYLQTLLSVEAQTTNLRKIAEMLLILTREPTGASDPELDRFELNAWLAAHVDSWQHYPRISDLHIDLSSTHNLWVTAHGGLLGQVVDNLWDNACKYSSPNTPITIRTMLVGDDVRLIVEDGGLGIAEHEIARIADPFYRSDNARSRGIGGTGLGLAIVKRIVNAIGAKLMIESAIGEGSVFTIVFPTAAR
jgi:two-component system OmpR family sensor kinase